MALPVPWLVERPDPDFLTFSERHI
jgi:hypothetical protein